MKLYLMRHGDYVAEDVRHGNPLSEKGQRDIRQIADFLSIHPIHVSRILHSEKLRAQQTASLLAQGLRCEKAPEEVRGLNPSDDVAAFAEELQHGEEDIALVGHLPFMGRLVGLLVSRNENKEIVTFQPGTLVCLEKIEAMRWMINWVLSPALFNDSTQ